MPVFVLLRSCALGVISVHDFFVLWQIVHMSDCGSAHAYWFFFVVLVLTNYVMLNLFVGMIMNNFAYISTKDGNGAVEDEHFVDAAFKYVQHLDPALKGQIPIEQVALAGCMPHICVTVPSLFDTFTQF